MNPETAKKVPEYMIQQGEDFLGKILARQGVWNAVLLGGPVPTAEDQDMQDIGVIAFFSIFNFSLQRLPSRLGYFLWLAQLSGFQAASDSAAF